MLDGFPKTRDDAAALEKQLTGLDFAAEAEMAAAASKLVPPGSEFLPDPHRKCTSGLDAVFLLSSIDVDILLKRAIERERSTRQDTRNAQNDDTTDKVASTRSSAPVERSCPDCRGFVSARRSEMDALSRAYREIAILVFAFRWIAHRNRCFQFRERRPLRCPKPRAACDRCKGRVEDKRRGIQ